MMPTGQKHVADDATKVKIASLADAGLTRQQLCQRFGFSPATIKKYVAEGRALKASKAA